MELTLAQIKDFAHNPKLYNQGLKYYEDGRVVSLDIDRNFDDEVILVNATVQDDKKYYEVNLAVTKDDYEIKAQLCSCPEHEKNLICYHVIAVLLKIYYTQLETQAKNAPVSNLTDACVLDCIKEYEQNIVYSALAMNNGKKVKIEPIFELEKNAAFKTAIPALSFKLGFSKSYQMKNPQNFLSDMKGNVVVRYGNECEFIHNQHSLDENAQKLLSFMESIENDAAYYQKESQFVLNNKWLYLRPASMDQLFETYLEHGINYHLEANRITNIVLVDDNPKLSLNVSLYNEDTYECSLSITDFILIEGRKTYYFYHDRHLYRLSESFAKNCASLLKAFYHQQQPLLIASKHMPSFYNNVLTSIRDDIPLLGCDISEFAPLPLVSKLYLDMPRSNKITARLIFSYGSEEYNAFMPTQMSTYRNFSEEITTQMAVRKYMTHFDNIKGIASIENSQDAFYEFFSHGISECEKYCQIYATDKIKAVQIKNNVSISMGVRIESDLLEVKFDTSDFPIEELQNVLQAYQLNKKYYRMKSGSFVNIEESALSELSAVLNDLHVGSKEIEKGVISLPKYRSLPLDASLSSMELLKVERDTDFKSLVKAIKNVKDSDFKVPAMQKPILRNYQKVGYRWLKTMASYGFGGILADDMGIGKTLQVITLFEDEKINHPESCSIVICPSSLILNWESEIAKFSPDLKALVVSGNAQTRALAIKDYQNYDVLITSYDYLKRDIELYENITFKYQILDEAQYIKNTATKNAICVKQIKSLNKFALTGTPIENSLAELWSIFDFLMPGYLFTYQNFKKSYEIPIVKEKDDTMLESLKRMVEPFILRRIKKDVLKELPEKVEKTMLIDMDEESRKLYLANVASIRHDLNIQFKEKGYDKSKILILSMLTKLRQFCCDPRLIYDDYTGNSDKLNACMELVHQCCETKKKVLIFSQFTSLLSLIEKELKKNKISYYLLKGSTPKNERQNYVHAFNHDDTQVFLISLKAGGTGLNLTSAEVVIHFDPWWNISAQNQATDRAYRLGQHNNVQVFKLIMKDTIEEKIQNLQELKKDLSDSIINENDGLITSMSKKELMDLF